MAANGNLHLSCSRIQKPGKVRANSLLSPAMSCVLPTLAVACRRPSLVSSPTEPGPRLQDARSPAGQPAAIPPCPAAYCAFFRWKRREHPSNCEKGSGQDPSSGNAESTFAKVAQYFAKLFCKTNFHPPQNYSTV